MFGTDDPTYRQSVLGGQINFETQAGMVMTFRIQLPGTVQS
jgi:hypothetical protein